MPAPAVEFISVSKVFPGRGNRPTFTAVDNIHLEVQEGEFFSLLGPSGCGKTTSLRMIAGFEDPTSGEVRIRGKNIVGIPPFHRPVNTVFQDYALFPHMTVGRNVAFGLEMEGTPRKQAEKAASEMLELVRLPNVEDRFPSQLSGGQQQRVALARALVKKPAVLLLDEPLGALDLKLRKALQFELKTLQKRLGITFVYVTHDQEEALTMSDRIAVMNFGHVLQVGDPEAIYETPATQFVADFIGETNFLRGKLVGRHGDNGIVQLDPETQITAELSDTNVPDGQEVIIAIRPEKVNLFVHQGMVKRGDGSSVTTEEYAASLRQDEDINLLTGTIQQAVYIGTDTRYVVKIGQSSELVVRVQNFGARFDDMFETGQKINVFWDAETARILLS